MLLEQLLTFFYFFIFIILELIRNKKIKENHNHIGFNGRDAVRPVNENDSTNGVYESVPRALE